MVGEHVRRKFDDYVLVCTAQGAVAEVSKIANYRRLVAVNHGSQSKATDGSKSGWRQRSVVELYL